MIPDQTATLLAQILAHPRVKKYGEARGWWTETKYSQCPNCKSLYPYDHKWCGRFLHGPTLVALSRVETITYTGPDLALPANLHELLGLADAIGRAACDVFKDGTCFCCEIPKHDPGIGHTGTGPTRTLAVIAALGRALGIEEKRKDHEQL